MFLTRRDAPPNGHPYNHNRYAHLTPWDANFGRIPLALSLLSQPELHLLLHVLHSLDIVPPANSQAPQAPSAPIKPKKRTPGITTVAWCRSTYAQRRRMMTTTRTVMVFAAAPAAMVSAPC